jgi:hypothetical protein
VYLGVWRFRRVTARFLQMWLSASLFSTPGTLQSRGGGFKGSAAAADHPLASSVWGFYVISSGF